MDDGMLAILLDIKEQNGSMEARLMEAARTNARMEASINKLKAKVETIEPVVKTVTEMKPQVDELMGLKNRAAAVVVVASFVLTAAFGLIFAGIKQFGPEIKALFSKWVV